MIGLYRYYISIFLISFCSILKGQWNDSTITRNQNLNFPDTSHSSSEANEIQFTNGKVRSDVFYDSLATKAGKKNWSRELHRLIIRNSTNLDKQNEDEKNRANNYFKYKDKIIRNIKVKQLDVFGPTITDTSKIAEKWVEKMGNSLHVSTNRRFIENNLFIDKGERLDPHILADNERILRNISSLQDVRIYVIPIEESPEYVDIIVLTKDVMAFGLSWEVFDVVYGEASIWNSNILGLGHELNYTAFYNLNREPKYGYNIDYKITNISNTFTSLELRHTNKNDLLVSAIRATRDFITPAIKFGGGIGYTNHKQIFTLETIDTVQSNVTSNYEYYDLWGGYSFPIKEVKMLKVRKNYFATGRFQQYNFFDRPLVAEDSLYDFHNREIFLGSIGITWQGYHKTNLVYGFGNTEDLPYGAMLKLTGGFENNEFNRRYYLSSLFTHSVYLEKYGYLSNTFELGGFYRNDIEQGAIKYDLLHITPLFGNTRHKFRNFVTANYTQGLNRFEDEFTPIEDETGIRGFNNDLLRGNKRIYINNEFVYYSPHYLYGFRFVYFLYADAGMINHKNDLLVNNPLYVSAGFGVRIRNERLIFNTVQLRFNFFPLSPGITGSNTQLFDFNSYPQYRMPDFANRKPETIEY